MESMITLNGIYFKEEEILKLNQRTRSLSERQKSNKVVVPELEEIMK